MGVSYRRISCAATCFAFAIAGSLGTAGVSLQAATFSSGESHVVASSETFVDVRDGGVPSGPTTLTIDTGGNIAFLNVYDTSIASAQGGEISHIVMNDFSHLTVDGTTISHVNLLHSSTAVMLAGRVDHFRAYDQSRGAIHGGFVGFVSALGLGPTGDVPAAMGHSHVDVFGGSVGVLRASVGGVVNVFGGTVGGINPFGGGTSNIYGGILNDMKLNIGTHTNVYGRDFNLLFTGLVSDIPEYRLTGKLSDGSPLNTLVLLPSGAVLRLVPEPTTGTLMLIAVIGIRLLGVSLCGRQKPALL